MTPHVCPHCGLSYNPGASVCWHCKRFVSLGAWLRLNWPLLVLIGGILVGLHFTGVI